MAGILANFSLNSQTILPVWPTFPTRCNTDGFFHFSICCSHCLGWYWGWQRTSWIRKTVMVFRWKIRACNICSSWQPQNFFNGENFPICGNWSEIVCCPPVILNPGGGRKMCHTIALNFHFQLSLSVVGWLEKVYLILTTVYTGGGWLGIPLAN